MIGTAPCALAQAMATRSDWCRSLPPPAVRRRWWPCVAACSPPGRRDHQTLQHALSRSLRYFPVNTPAASGNPVTTPIPSTPAGGVQVGLGSRWTRLCSNCAAAIGCCARRSANVAARVQPPGRNWRGRHRGSSRRARDRRALTISSVGVRPSG